MSTAPTRSRSIRKPGVGIGPGLQDKSGANPPVSTISRRNAVETEPKPSERRLNQSPSRLPVKPPSFAAPTGHTRTRSVAQNGTGNLGASMRPPPRSITTRPPLSSDNSKATIRSGAKTPTDSAGSGSSTLLQRKPSNASASRNARSISTSTAATSTIPPTRSHSQRTSTATSSNIIPPQTRSHTRNASTLVSSGITAPQTRGHTRATSMATSSMVARPQSQSTVLRPPSQSTILRPPSQSTAILPPPAPNSPIPSNISSRPTFSTLQQHYSPLKSLAPKPATATFLVPPSPSKHPTNIAISAETARLQAELLQLHILHRESVEVQREWRESAQMRLGERFEVVKRDREVLVREEEIIVEGLNGKALHKWGEGNVRGWGLEEKIQVLDGVLTGVWSLGEGGGRYGRVMRKFERWLDSVQDTVESREKESDGLGVSNCNGDIVFVAGMEEAWKEECDNLLRKLLAWKDQTLDLGTLDGKSSLAQVLRGIRNLVDTMTTELITMRKIERSVVDREREWIAAMCDDESDDEDGGVGIGGAWRR